MEEVKIAVPILTVSEYARQTKSTADKIRTLCDDGILPAYKTSGGQWRILVNSESVPRDVHEKALQKISFLEGKLKSLKAILENV